MFIAAYDRPDGDAYDRHVVRLARRWLKLLSSPQATQAVVDKLLQEFDGPVPEGYGCAWEDLNRSITNWAVAEEWIARDE